MANKEERKKEKDLASWQKYINKNPKIMAYFQAQDLDLEQSHEQFRALQKNVESSDAFKRKQTRFMVIGSAVSFALSVSLMPVVTVAGTAILGGLLTTMCFSKMKELETGLKSAAPYMILNQYANEFNEKATHARELGIENPFPPRKIVKEDGSAIKITI